MKKLTQLFLVLLMTFSGPGLFAQVDKDFSQLAKQIKRDNVKKVTKLISKGANVNAVDEDGTTPLLLAIQLNKNLLANMLIDAGADIKMRDDTGSGCLHYAVLHPFSHDIINLLIEQGIDVNSINDVKNSPFLLALKLCNDYPSLLINNGADYSQVNGYGQNALHYLAASGCDSIFDSMAYRIPEFDLADENGDTPFLLAAKNEHNYIANKLLEMGADISAKDADSKTAIYYSVKNNDTEFFNRLMKYLELNNLENEDMDDGGHAILISAAEKENIDIIKTLLNDGATLDETQNLHNSEGHTYKLGLIYFAKAELSPDEEKLATYQRSLNYFTASQESFKSELTKIRTKETGAMAGQVCLGALSMSMGVYTVPTYTGNVQDSYRKELLKSRIASCDSYIQVINEKISSLR